MDIGRLIGQLRDGDDTAGPVLVSVVSPRLTGYAEMIAPDLPQADRELIVEHALEKAIRRIDRYDPNKGTFPGWVRTFVRYAVGDWRRRYPKGAPAQLDDRTMPIDLDSDLEEVRDNPLSLALAACARTLSETDQLIIRLHYEESLPHAQIGQRIGVSEAASRKRLERAISRLRSCAMEDDGIREILEGGFK